MTPLLKKLPQPKKPNTVYGLFDPDTKELRYIGLTTVGFKRIIEHWETAHTLGTKKKTTKVQKWTYSLKVQNKIFDVFYFEYFDDNGIELDESEQFHIAYYKSIGCNLLNQDWGGRRQYLYNKSTANKYLISTKIKQAWANPKLRENQSLVSKKNWADPKLRQQMIDNASGMTEACQEGRKKLVEKQIPIIEDAFGNIYKGLDQAAQSVGVTRVTIHKAIIGLLKTAGGRKFKLISGGTGKPSTQKLYQKKGRKLILNPIKDQHGTTYTNVSDAAKKLNIDKRGIFAVLAGTQNSAGGYKFTKVI